MTKLPNLEAPCNEYTGEATDTAAAGRENRAQAPDSGPGDKQECLLRALHAVTEVNKKLGELFSAAPGSSREGKCR